MVHETKLLTFWRQLNKELGERGARHVELDVASIFFESGVWTPAEVADMWRQARATTDLRLYPPTRTA